MDRSKFGRGQMQFINTAIIRVNYCNAIFQSVIGTTVVAGVEVQVYFYRQ